MLIQTRLVAEVPTAPGVPVWKHSEGSSPVMLVATAAGLAAIGIEGRSRAPLIRQPVSSVRSANRWGPAGGKATRAAPTLSKRAQSARGATSRPGGPSRGQSKQGTCIALLRPGNGASIPEMMTATGWQAHSVRGFLSVVGGELGILGASFLAIHLLPNIAVAVRRTHDSNMSGWWALLFLVPTAAAPVENIPGLDDTMPIPIAVLALATLVAMIVILVRPSTPGPNRFGPNQHDQDGRREQQLVPPQNPFASAATTADRGTTPPRTGHPVRPGPHLGRLMASLPGRQPLTTLEQLERLAALRASGAIDDVEFSLLKSELLGAEAGQGTS